MPISRQKKPRSTTQWTEERVLKMMTINKKQFVDLGVQLRAEMPKHYAKMLSVLETIITKYKDTILSAYATDVVHRIARTSIPAWHWSTQIKPVQSPFFPAGTKSVSWI